MSEQLQGVLWTALALVVVAVIGAIANAIVKHLRGRASEPELWKRLDELSVEVYGGRGTDGATVVGLQARVAKAERVGTASASIIRDLARQWTGNPPRLNPADIAELDEDTIPDHWKVKP